MLDFGRTTGVSGLLGLDFQRRATMLRALAKFLQERKDALYSLSYLTGATRSDSWVDIEGGIGTLMAYASIGSNDFPSGNVVHEGPAFPLGKKGGFAGTHILVPRGGIAVHINAFNFPVWGLLEKFAPAFLAGMPCVAKPATATSFLTEALVRQIDDSGILPAGSLQLVIGSTGDLLDRLLCQDVVTFTGSADTLNCAILAPDVGPDDEEFELFVREVAREMISKAGQKCTAIRRAIVPRRHVETVAERLRARLKSTVVGDPADKSVQMGPLASKAQQADVAERVALLRKVTDLVFGAEDGFQLHGEDLKGGAFFAPTLLLCRDGFKADAVH